MTENKASYSVSSIVEDLMLVDEVSEDVDQELLRQRNLYGVQRHLDNDWLPILGEEFGEVCQALQKDTTAAKETDADDLYKELVQVAAVAISWAAHLKERR